MNALDEFISAFNRAFVPLHHTSLIGGFEEPIYIPALGSKNAEIRFTKDYFRSALHEVAHWCVAGEKRRLLEDYGYWYAPDGRNADEQEAFFRMELKPQALEKAFSEKCGIPFEVSCDNLRGPCGQKDLFEKEVDRELRRLRQEGFSKRSQMVLKILEQVASTKITS